MSAPASSLIWAAAGYPVMPANAEGRCRACGVYGTGDPFARWVKDSFNDRDKLFPGEITCSACLFCFSDKNEELRARLNREKIQKTRNYSHFIINGEWLPLSKGEKRQMRAALLANPSVAVVAVSGQKHLIFRSRIGFWQVEEQTVRPFPELLDALLVSVEEMYEAGASKTEIESGHYSQITVLKMGFDRWVEGESKIRGHRGGLPLQLAVFLAQRDEHGKRTDSQ